MGQRAAAVLGARQVFFAVIATTLTLIAVFVPISFLPSEAGRLFTEFGFVLAVTVAISSFVALTICPMLASLTANLGGEAAAFSAGSGQAGRRLWHAVAAHGARAAPDNRGGGVARRRRGFSLRDLGEELVPSEDRGMISVWLQGPDGTGLDYTDRQVVQVEAALRPFVEEGVGQGLYSITGRYDLNRGSIGMRLKPWDEREISQGEIEAAIRDD
jgi:HAE1 family hydrophobic/amphiphilic exporter-1